MSDCRDTWLAAAVWRRLLWPKSWARLCFGRQTSLWRKWRPNAFVFVRCSRTTGGLRENEWGILDFCHSITVIWCEHYLTYHADKSLHERSSHLEGYGGFFLAKNIVFHCFFQTHGWHRTSSMETSYVYPLFLYVGDLAHNRLPLGGRSCGLEIENQRLRRHRGEQ